MTWLERLLALRTTPPFNRLRDTELALIADVACVARRSPNEIICSPEKPLRRLHVVVEGSIQDPAGTVAPPVFGAEALLLDLPIPGTWRAGAEGSLCLLINKGNFHTIVHECPELVVGLLVGGARTPTGVGADGVNPYAVEARRPSLLPRTSGSRGVPASRPPGSAGRSGA
jgi:hypothetical protein